MGCDCKGISVIAKNLLKWNEICPDKQIVESAARGIEWCSKNTDLNGNCIGGIFAYSLEGAVVHDMHTYTAFTYACSYALEAEAML